MQKNHADIAVLKNISIFAPAITQGAIAQLVEQRTENPCVPGSIPGGTTKKPLSLRSGFFVVHMFGPFNNGSHIYSTVVKYSCFTVAEPYHHFTGQFVKLGI